MKSSNLTSNEFGNFKNFVRKIVSVPKAEIDAIKEQEKQDKLDKKPPTKPVKD